MLKKILFSILCIGSFTEASNFDVYGRDMNYAETSYYSYINFVGHLGMEVNNKVWNMLPKASKTKARYTGQSNYLHIDSIKTFKYPSGKPKNWGKVSPKVTKKRSAYGVLWLTKYLGAKYTIKVVYSKRPAIYYNSRTKRYSFRRGTYRCDSFVADVLDAGGKKHSYIITPKKLFNEIKDM